MAVSFIVGENLRSTQVVVNPTTKREDHPYKHDVDV
jgi:hypothetical protein